MHTQTSKENSSKIMDILVTGASGFIGSFIVEEALKRGYTVWAAIRRNSSLEFLQDNRIRFIELDLSSPVSLNKEIAAFLSDNKGWDYIVHAAGATKCVDKSEFMKINFEGTKNLIEALRRSNILPRQFIYLSSLSIFGPIREEQPYTPITESDEARPNTAYGYSKIMAEAYIRACPDLPYVIFRPTGVYGPRERDYYKMAVSIKNHIDFAAGYKPQTITFIYVKDLVKAIFLAIDKRVTRKCYFVSEKRGYSSRSFSNYIQRELDIKNVLHITAPIWLLKIVSLCAEQLSRITKKPSTLNRDKFNIMRQRNWLCDTTKTEEELNFTTSYDLESGTRETIKWYKENKWL